MPAEAIAAMRHYYFDLRLCHELYGFPDAFHGNPAQLAAAEAESNHELRRHVMQTLKGNRALSWLLPLILGLHGAGQAQEGFFGEVRRLEFSRR